jgi:hypothetical protein
MASSVDWTGWSIQERRPDAPERYPNAISLPTGGDACRLGQLH